MDFNNQGHYGLMAQGFMAKVYGWMCAGLAVTAAVSYYLSPEVNPKLMHALTSNFLVVLGIFAASFGLLMYMQWNFAKISYTTMSTLFIIFCALEGLTLSPILYIYTASSVFYVFLIAAGMFAIMALYGWFTDTDLSSMKNILSLGLAGLLIAMIINIFVKSSGFSLLISSFAVGIFTLMIAYDIQNLKKYSQQVLASPEDTGKFALRGAIDLYLHMINLFIHLLRLFGEERRK